MMNTLRERKKAPTFASVRQHAVKLQQENASSFAKLRAQTDQQLRSNRRLYHQQLNTMDANKTKILQNRALAHTLSDRIASQMTDWMRCVITTASLTCFSDRPGMDKDAPSAEVESQLHKDLFSAAPVTIYDL